MSARHLVVLVSLCLALAARGQEGGYRLMGVLPVAGRQGVATDGQYYYVSGSKALYKYDREGNLLAENTAPFAGWHPTANHLGDIDCHNGLIYGSVEEFRDGRGWDMRIALYDASDLKYVRNIPCDASSGQQELCGLAVDPKSRTIWLADWCDGRFLYHYDLASGKFLGRRHLYPVPEKQQGVAWHFGHLYLTADDGDADRGEMDHLYRLDVAPEATSARVDLVRTFGEFKRVGEIEGLCFDGKSRELVVLANRGARIVEGIPVGLYPGYEKEISELYVFELRKP